MSNTDPPQSYNDVRAAVTASLRLGVSVWLHYGSGFYLMFGHYADNNTIITDCIAKHLVDSEYTTGHPSLMITNYAFERYTELNTKLKCLITKPTTT